MRLRNLLTGAMSAHPTQPSGPDLILCEQHNDPINRHWTTDVVGVYGHDRCDGIAPMDRECARLHGVDPDRIVEWED
jgi:hypothetical protein